MFFTLLSSGKNTEKKNKQIIESNKTQNMEIWVLGEKPQYFCLYRFQIKYNKRENK